MMPEWDAADGISLPPKKRDFGTSAGRLEG